jgi:hypothetical protein
MTPSPDSKAVRSVDCEACDPNPRHLPHPDWCKCEYCGCPLSSHPGPIPDLLPPQGDPHA